MAAALRSKSQPDDDDTQADLDRASDLRPPGPSKATIVLADAQLDVKVPGDERDDDEKHERPFAEIDKESLLVLYHAVRAEVGCR